MWINLLLLLITSYGAQCSKILAMLTVPSHSHHLWSTVYLETLAARGHEITYLAVDEYKNTPKNIRHIYLEAAYDLYTIMNFTQLSDQNPYYSVYELDIWEDIAAESASQQKGFQKFLEIVKNEKFDLVIYDTAGTAFLLGAVDILGKPPILGVTPFSIPSWNFQLSGTPYPIQYNSHMMLKYGKEMTYFERLDNAAMFLFTAFHRYFHLENQNALSQKVFGPGVRHVSDIFQDINVNIVNGNWVTDNPFPHTPGLIPIAGAHIRPVKPLPKDLQEYLDSSKDGVIFFSLGSNILSIFLQPDQINSLIEAFKQLAPIRVLWKFEKDLPGKPDNVRIGKWLPQNDILGHPNVRLFFTHGGMLSTQEAFYHGVPIVGMPIFLDQHINVNKACRKGIGEHVKLDGLKTENIVKTIRKVLNNRSYKENAVAQSKIFRDGQNSPMEELVYWTEYVIRHNGAKHLRPASKEFSWFQNGLYDLILTALGGLLLVFYFTYKILKFVLRLLFGSKNKRKQE